MKVLIATHFFPPNHPGGTEAYTLGLARMLRRKGHASAVICAEDWGKGDSWHPRAVDDEYEGIPVRRLYWNWQLAPNPFVQLYDHPAVNDRLARFLQQSQPDVVHVTSCYTLGAGIIRVARHAGLPVVLTLTDFWFLCPRHTLLRGDGTLCSGPADAVTCLSCLGQGARVYRTATRLFPPAVVARGLLLADHLAGVNRFPGLRGYVGDAMRRLSYLRAVFDEVDVALAPSRFLLETFVRHGFPPERLRYSPYGLDLSWLDTAGQTENGGHLRFGYIGQIDPLKGVDIVVRAFRAAGVADRAELRIHGDLTKNPRYAALLRQIAAGEPAISFRGPFERAEIAGVYAGIDVLIVPSVWYENTPIVIAEAFAAGKPVIATNLGGMSEVVRPGVNGLLFERGDVGGLARAIRQLTDDPALLERLRRGIEPVRTIEAEVEDLLDLYARLVAGRDARVSSGRV
ncbi:MAG TPA: glycosyltransferase family 4 protein [Isosphaeraceae bacterium]|nr:glycosyltransferase family 4 protein [Isosphaeraceae bacterium]